MTAYNAANATSLAYITVDTSDCSSLFIGKFGNKEGGEGKLISITLRILNGSTVLHTFNGSSYWSGWIPNMATLNYTLDISAYDSITLELSCTVNPGHTGSVQNIIFS